MLEDSISEIPSTGLNLLCVCISVALAGAFPVARWIAGGRSEESREQTRRGTLHAGLGVLAWLGLTGAVAAAGLLDDFSSFPPPVMPVLVSMIVVMGAVTASKLGARLAFDLPLALLVGYQGFRIAVEIMLHLAGSEGVIGAQMTWSGLNFDVLSGISGLLLGLWLWRRDPGEPEPRALLWAWNLIGLGLLITIVVIALLSVPGPLRQFGGPPNVWIGTWPFVWLPTMMVGAAFLGHLLLARRLLQSRSVGS